MLFWNTDSSYRSSFHLFITACSLMLYVVAGNLSNDIYLPCLPHLQHVFGVPAELILLSLTAWFLGDSVPQLFMGPLCDRVGLRTFARSSLLLFIVGTILCLLEYSYPLFLLGRVLQGIGVCAMTILSFATIQQYYSGDKKIKMLAILSICHTTAPLLGPLLGAYLFSWWGWQSTFVLVLLLALLSGGTLWFTLDHQPQNRPIPVKNLLAEYLSLVKQPNLLLPLLGYGLLFAAIIIFLTTGPILFEDLFKLGPKAFGVSQIFIFGAYIIGSSLNMKFAKIPSKSFLKISVGVLLISCALFYILAIISIASVYSLLIPLILLSFGFGLGASRLTNAILDQAGKSSGLCSALIGFSMTGFGCIGSLICSLVFNGELHSVTMLIVACSLLSCIIQSIYLLQGKNLSSITE